MKHRLRRMLLTVKDAWLIFGIAFVMLLILEGVLSLVYVAWDSLQTRSRTILYGYGDPCVIDAYPGITWLQDYSRESVESHKTRWVSYVYWRCQPYQGEHINIDVNGIRKTWAPDREQAGSGDPMKVFMFGGSTMWGAGARDDFTIPSCLARRLHEKGVECQITNFGEAGYVTTQEIILLIRQLQEGNIPDLVIFYDGVNDMYTAYQQQVAGLPENEFNRVREFNLTQPAYHRSLRKAYIRGAVRGLSTVRFFGRVAQRLGLAALPRDSVTHQTGTADILVNDEALLQSILTVYQSNVVVARTLAQSFGFKALFYWQPSIFDKEHLTPGEQTERRKAADLEPFIRKTCALMRQKDLATANPGCFRDLSSAFSQAQEPVFTDWCHLCESGNDLIAQKIALDVLAQGELATFVGEQ